MTESKPRRGRGEGTVIPRANGTWYAQLSGPEGRETISGKTKKEVLGKLRARQNAIESEVPTVKVKMTVEDFFSYWLADVVKPSTSESTHANYSSQYRLWIGPTLGKLSLPKVGPDDCNTTLRAMAEGGMSPATRKMARSVMMAAFSHAVERKILSVNPCHGVATPRVSTADGMVLTAVQVKTFLAACSTSRLAGLWQTGFFTGMRLGEMFALTKRDIDLDTGLIHVRKTQSILPGGRVILKEPKTTSGKRSVAIGAALIGHLETHFERMKAEGNGESEFVFCDKDGSMHNRTGRINRQFNRIVKKAGLPRIRIHDMRHTHATILLQDGENPVVVSQRLGHANVKQTLFLYGHVMPGMQEDAAKRLDKLLG